MGFKNLYLHFKAIAQTFSLYPNLFSLRKLGASFFHIRQKGFSPFPLTINMLLTQKCNMSCQMCSWDSQKKGDDQELSFDEIKTFVLSVKNKNPIFHLGGGEPLIRKDVLRIIRIIKDNNLKCLMTTNGFLLSESSVDDLVASQMDVIIFSLYGWGEVHDEITGKPGSFEQVKENIVLVLKKRTKNMRVIVSTVPLKENLDNLTDLVKEVYNLGVDAVKIEQLNYLTEKELLMSDEADKNFKPATHIINGHHSEDYVLKLLAVYEDLRKTYRGFVFIKPSLSFTQIHDWYTTVPERNDSCSFISHSVFVNYNGDIIPCQFLPYSVVGSIKNDFLGDVWGSDSFMNLRNDINSKSLFICKRCCKN